MNKYAPQTDQPSAVSVPPLDGVVMLPSAAPVNASSSPQVVMVQSQQTVDANGLRLGDWNVELFSCLKHCIPNAMMAWCCPCVSVAQITSRVGFFSYTKVLLGLGMLQAMIVFISLVSVVEPMNDNDRGNRPGRRGGKSNNVLSRWTEAYHARALPFELSGRTDVNFALLALSFMFTIFVVIIRKRLRKVFQIQGSVIQDFFEVCCCQCCAIAQMASHVKSYNIGKVEFGPPATLPGYATVNATTSEDPESSSADQYA